jgi:hypothetical protein
MRSLCWHRQHIGRHGGSILRWCAVGIKSSALNTLLSFSASSLRASCTLGSPPAVLPLRNLVSDSGNPYYVSGGVSDAVHARCGYWGCPIDPFIQSQSGGMVTPQSPAGTIYNSSPRRPSPGEVVQIPDAVRARCGYSPFGLCVGWVSCAQGGVLELSYVGQAFQKTL